jgi:hypothetical protein
MSNKKQTAVEWIGDNIQFDMTFVDVFGLIRQAKEMEKQQIIDAYWDGGQDIPLTENRCEQYYKETYEQ